MSPATGTAPDHSLPAAPGLPLARGALHEFYAAAEADGAGLSALAVMLAWRPQAGPVLWVRHGALAGETGEPYPPGIVELGLDPARLLLLRARDVTAALQAALEGARCAALAAVIVEMRGEARAYDLTASRRLVLAARGSGVPVFLLRSAAAVVASAAETRWRMRTAPSRALAANAPGYPAFHLTLLRTRRGQEGQQHHLEWNSDAQGLDSRLVTAGPERGRPSDTGPGAPLSRPVVSLSFNRPGTPFDRRPARKRAG